MTTTEHMLVVQMFTEQAKMLSTLVAILESRGILQKTDLDAYDHLQSADESRVDEIERGVAVMYQRFATFLDVTTGLPRVAESGSSTLRESSHGVCADARQS